MGDSLPRTDDMAYDLRMRLDRAVRWLRDAEDIARFEMSGWPTADRIRSIYEQVSEDVLNGKTTIPPVLERLRVAEGALRRVQQAKLVTPGAGWAGESPYPHCPRSARQDPGDALLMAASLSGQRTQGGQDIGEFCEREIGSPLSNAISLNVLGGEVEASREQWAYDESPEAVELVRLCAELDDYLKRLSIKNDGTLTLWRECSRCGGAGEWHNEKPCVECHGEGAMRS